MDEKLRTEIEMLMLKRAEFRNKKEWALADQIKHRLENDPFHVEISDYCDRPSTWKIVRPTTRTVTWSSLSTTDINDDTDHDELKLPIVIATVDSPHYRARLENTRKHLSEPCNGCCDKVCKCSFQPYPCDLLDLAKHPSLGSKKVLFEGWRTILLPKLLKDGVSCIIRYQNSKFVLVAEDDVRLGRDVSARRIRNECAAVFVSNPTLDILSLGHAWAAIRKHEEKNGKQDSLVNRFHGTTLLAIRFPEGVEQLAKALEGGRRKQTHFDQFLFHSTQHDLSVALCTPPLVGWAEVDTTLTNSASGNKRHGGGRLAFLPPHAPKVNWVSRRLMVKNGASP